MLVVANKSDMTADRAVSQEEGQALANEFGASFMEVSVSLLHLNRFILYQSIHVPRRQRKILKLKMRSNH
jgi:hypothetical protein